MISSAKESLQHAIADLSEADCVQVLEFVQSLQNGDLEHEPISGEVEFADETEDPFEEKNGILVLKSGSVDPKIVESALARDREERIRKLMSW